MKKLLKANRRMLYVFVFLLHPFLTTALEPGMQRIDSAAVRLPGSESKPLKDVAAQEVVGKKAPVRELYLESPAEVRLLDGDGHVLPAGKEARMVVISGLRPGVYHLRDETGKLHRLRIR